MYDKNQEIQIRPDGSRRVCTHNLEPSMTQQQFKDECDINNIMKKYSDTGTFTHITSKQGRYADFSSITDYRDMLHTVQYAQEAFSALPADVRKRFQNDPGQLLAFVQDPKNYDEGVKLGLCQPREGSKTQNAKTNSNVNANGVITNPTNLVPNPTTPS